MVVLCSLKIQISPKRFMSPKALRAIPYKEESLRIPGYLDQSTGRILLMDTGADSIGSGLRQFDKIHRTQAFALTLESSPFNRYPQ